MLGLNCMPKFTQNLILFAVIFLMGLVIGGAIVFKNPGLIEKKEALSSEEAAQKAIDYINEQILGGQQTASLIEIKEESGLYKLRLKIDNQEFGSYVTKDAKLLFPSEAIDIEQQPVAQPQSTIGDFLVSEDEVCKENEKPLVYFFGSEGCPHCQWEHPIIEEAASKFGDKIAFHNNMDTDADLEIFQKYSTGGIPTLVLGCRYYRVGSGERLGEEEEARVLTALICKLTDSQPTEICEPVSELIGQISD